MSCGGNGIACMYMHAVCVFWYISDERELINMKWMCINDMPYVDLSIILGDVWDIEIYVYKINRTSLPY